jgi:toxin ParE1/3/4
MKILWSTPAVDDLESIQDFIARDSQYYAASFIDKILHAIDTLQDLSGIGRRVPEADEPNIRELLFQSYRIMYRITNDTVQMIAIIHGSRDISRWPLKPWEII